MPRKKRSDIINETKKFILNDINDVKQLLESKLDVPNPRQFIRNKIKKIESAIENNNDILSVNKFTKYIDELRELLEEKHPKKCHPGPSSNSYKMNSCFNREYQENRIEIPRYNNVTIARR